MKSSITIILIFIGLHFVTAQKPLSIACADPFDLEEHQDFVACIEFKKENLDLRQALNVANKGIKLYPYSYGLRYRKGIILEGLGNTAAAEKEIIGLIKLYPEKQELHNSLGRILYDKDRSKALLALLNSVLINPNNYNSKENLSFIRHLLDGHTIKNQKKANNAGLQSFTVNDFEPVNKKLKSIAMQQSNTDSQLVPRLTYFFKILDEYQHRKEGFYWKVYAKRFVKIYKNNSVDKLVAYISGDEGIAWDGHRFIEN